MTGKDLNMKKIKRLFTAVLSLCLIMGLVATSTITSEAKGKKKSAKKAKAVATSTVNDPALFALMVASDGFTYNGKTYSTTQISRMNLEQVANLMGLTVSKSDGNGSIEDPWGYWTAIGDPMTQAHFDYTFADSADGLVHIDRFTPLDASAPVSEHTLMTYDGVTIEINLPMNATGFTYDSTSAEGHYGTYGDSWNVKALDTYLRTNGYVNMSDVLNRNGLTVRTYTSLNDWSTYIASDGWGFKDTMTINGVKYPYHASVRPNDFDNPSAGTDTTLMILKPDGSIIGYVTDSLNPSVIHAVTVS